MRRVAVAALILSLVAPMPLLVRVVGLALVVRLVQPEWSLVEGGVAAGTQLGLADEA